MNNTDIYYPDQYDQDAEEFAVYTQLCIDGSISKDTRLLTGRS